MYLIFPVPWSAVHLVLHFNLNISIQTQKHIMFFFLVNARRISNCYFCYKGYAKDYVYVFKQLLRLWLDSNKISVKALQAIATIYVCGLLYLVCKGK